MSNKEVRAIYESPPTGYKQTEVGVIPEDWEVIDYESMGIIIDGDRGANYPSGNDLKHNGDCMFLNAGNVTKDGFRFNNCEFITFEKDRKLSNGKLKREDVVLTTRGTVGNFAYYNTLVPFDNIRINSGMVIMRNDSTNVNTSYQYLLMKSHIGKLQIKQLSFGSAQPQLTVKGISKLKIPLPPTIEEQTAIATALSDADVLILSLEKLITKKNAIKQGAMQRLFKPKEGWVAKRLGEMGSPYGGLAGKSINDFHDGTYPYIPFMNIMSNTIIDTTYFDFVSLKPGENQNTAQKGDLFFNGSSETPDEVGMCSVLLDDIPNLYLNSFCFGFRLNKESQEDGLYLSYYFRSELGRNLFFSLAQGATRYNLSKSNFLKLKILLPKPEEQTRIATILSDIDAEIAALETKLAKYKQIKQGMMQNLLTGRIRLV